MNKFELLDWLSEKDRDWEDLLDQVGPARMELPGVNGDWSMKDLVAHLVGWNEWLVARMQAAARREAKPLPPWPAYLHSDDEVNAWIYAANRGRPLGEVLDEMRRVHQQLLAVIEGLPDDVHIDTVESVFHLVWVGDQRFEAGEFFDHFRDDHEADVRLWLRRSGAA